MAQVTVTIAGRTFRMACGDGEEPHLEALARQIDEKINELRGAFGEIGDQRLTVMAAISFADDLAESNKKIAQLEGTLSTLRAGQNGAASAQALVTDAIASAVEETAVRIEKIAKSMR